MITKWNKYAQTTGYVLGRIRPEGCCMGKYEYLSYDQDTGEDVWDINFDYNARTTYSMALTHKKMYPDSKIIQVTCIFEERT